VLPPEKIRLPNTLKRMSKRNKLQKFAEILSFPHVYENFSPEAPQLLGKGGEPVAMRGRWNEAHFHNEHSITLELACGRGEYSVALARQFPERNFIGVDVKGARIWKGARIALEEGLQNVAFLRTRIEQIHYFFAPAEVSEIWVTFPDPFPRKSKANRRLTAPPFLDRYRKILTNGGWVHLKTDSEGLYEFTLESLQRYEQAELLYQDDDIYAGELPLPELGIRTYYEHLHLREGKNIKYVKFRLKG